MPNLNPSGAPYDNINGRVSSNFWGSPVVQLSDGTLSCAGYVGPTYSKRIWDYVTIAVPYNAPSEPKTPGICEVTCDKSRDVDKKKQKGSDGARITLAGLEPAMVDIKITIWTPQQLKELETLRAIVFPGPQKKTTTKLAGGTAGTESTFTVGSRGSDLVPEADRVQNSGALKTVVPKVSTLHKVTTTKFVTVTQPFDVSHPVLDAQGVKALVFFKVEGPNPGKAAGSMIYTFKAIEFLLPKKGVNATNTPTGSVARDSTLERP